MKRPGLTLSECLLVLAIVAILLTLLTTAVQTAQLASNVTLCQRNLSILYQAEVLRMCDLHTSMFASGPSWNSSLLPYVENRMEVFQCPASVGPLEISSGTVTQTSGGGPTGDQGTGGDQGASNAGAPVLAGFDVAFDVFSDRNLTNFLWNVSINSIWCKATANFDVAGFTDCNGHSHPDPLDSLMTPAYTWRYRIEDRGFLVEQTGDWGWADDYADIDVAVTYDGSTPTFIKILQYKSGSQGYRYNMLINGTTVVHNIDNHQGMVIDLRPQQSQHRRRQPGQWRYLRHRQFYRRRSELHVFPLRLRDERRLLLGQLWFQVAEEHNPIIQDVPRIDAKLFLLLDYPKRLANYNIDGEDYGQGDKYFITDPDAWKATYDPNNTGMDWTQYQALRHFKMANVLFCDGHIELLPYMYSTIEEEHACEYLYQDSPLWVYGRPVHSFAPLAMVADTGVSGQQQAAGSSSSMPASGEDNVSTTASVGARIPAPGR